MRLDVPLREFPSDLDLRVSSLEQSLSQFRREYLSTVQTLEKGATLGGIIKGYLQSANFITGSSGYRIDEKGNAEFQNADISGTITTTNLTATGGAIGGWTISSLALYKDGATDAVSSGMAPADYPFYAGSLYANRATAPFRVTPAGAVVATSADITGTITATDGKISNWFINTNTIADSETEANANVLIDSANTLIRLGPTAGDYITLDGANQRIRSSNYSAGNAGFTIEPGLLEAENIHARGKLSSVVFQYDVQTAVGGMMIVANADKLAVDMTAADNSTLTIDGDTTFAVNDILRIKDGTNDEYMRVTDITSAPTYVVTRDLGAAYAAGANPQWKKGNVVVKHGSSDGSAAYSGGWLKLLGAGTNSPYYEVVKRTGVAYNAYTAYARLGNLNGFLDYSADEYGAGIGEANNYFKYDPTNGLRIKATKSGNIITIETDPLKILVNDGTYDRIKVGEVAAGKYGIEIRSATGVLMLDIDDDDQKISTNDGKTYFDLKNSRLIVNDGTNDRVLIGLF